MTKKVSSTIRIGAPLLRVDDQLLDGRIGLNLVTTRITNELDVIVVVRQK